MRFKELTILGLSWGLVFFASGAALAQDDAEGSASLDFRMGASSEGEAEAEGEAEGNLDAETEEEADDEPATEDEEDDDRGEGGGDEGGGDGGGGVIERPLLLKRHTLELGGQIGVTSGVNVPHNNPPADTDGGGVFFFSPRVGYFVIDQLELVTEFDFQVGFGVRNPSDLPVDGANVGFGAGMQYIFDFHVICLYLGGLVGASFYVPYGAGPTVPYFRVRIPVGIMFPFNHHVALNAGLETQIDVHLGDDPGYTTIYFPIGYFGIRGFFNLCRKQN